jgi:hypothetical protein
MPDTGAPWNIPYVEPADLVRDYPAADEAQALAVAAGLDSASTLKQVKQVTTTTNFTTTSTSAVDLTGVTVTVVPSDAANRIVMFFTASQSNANSARDSFYGFRRTTTDLFEEVEVTSTESSGDVNTVAMMFDEVAGSTDSRTYSIRVRVASGTLTVQNSSLVVMEYSV